MTGEYARLWRADPIAWRSTGTTWQGASAVFDRRADELAEAGTALRPAWSGGAAGAADGRLGALRAELRILRPALIEADQVLAEFAVRLHRARAALARAVEQAIGAGLLVDREGRVSADPATRRAPAGLAVDRAAAQVQAPLELARAADREAASRLTALAAATRAGWATAPPAYRPPLGVDPVLVRLWWARLSPAERRWLIGHEPALVGRLDGVPVAARDQANRLLVEEQRAALLAGRAALLRRLPIGGWDLAGVGLRAELARVGARLAAVDALAERLAAPAGPRPYLVALDPAGDGRAVVALGNPDRSANVLTYVPGMTADLADVGGELERAARVLHRCGELAPATETAAVLWLDYDAPDFLGEASGPGPAEEAGASLHRFQEGLRLTHDDGPPARQTVLGHSYGSLVVGSAARDHGLAADSLVFVGSPGVGVEHAAGLGLPPHQVWSSTAPDDVIRLARPPAELIGRLAAGPLPALADRIFGHQPDDELWFGTDPSRPGFGGQVFPSGSRGHTGYWDAGNPALDGMARIVLTGSA